MIGNLPGPRTRAKQQRVPLYRGANQQRLYCNTFWTSLRTVDLKIPIRCLRLKEYYRQQQRKIRTGGMESCRCPGWRGWRWGGGICGPVSPGWPGPWPHAGAAGSAPAAQHTLPARSWKKQAEKRAPDKMRILKIYFNFYNAYFFTKSYFWSLVRIVSLRRF